MGVARLAPQDHSGGSHLLMTKQESNNSCFKKCEILFDLILKMCTLPNLSIPMKKL